MVKREKRGDKAAPISTSDEISTEVSDGEEWTDEEQKWLDDIWNLDSAPFSLRENRKFMLAAVKKDGRSLEYASPELQNDKEIVIAAVSDMGEALEFASDALKDDKEVVRAALECDGLALEFASENLQNDIEMVKVAVNDDGLALQFASDDLKEDVSLVLEAVRHNWEALNYSNVAEVESIDDLKADPKLWEIVSLYMAGLKNIYGGYFEYWDEVDNGDKEEYPSMDVDVFEELWEEINGGL